MLRYFLAFTALCSPAMAEAPHVAVDIPPLHSLVAQVMEGVGTPDLVLPPGLSPHDVALRPADAQALAGADLIVWTGPELSPAIARAVEALAEGEVLTLLDIPETVVLPFRTGAVFEAHDHGDHGEHGDHEEHGDHGDHDAHGDHGEHGDHEEHGEHEEHAAHEEHDEAHDHDHDHDGRDPHAWLDPANAALWVEEIAQTLSALDPDNAETYAANAADAQARIAIQRQDIATRIAALDEAAFVVFHDAYHYFEARFGVEAAGAIALGDGATPDPRRLGEIVDAIEELNVTCVFAEPQFNAQLVEVSVGDAGARIGVIDPLGMRLEPGAELYGALMEGMIASFESCLAPQ